MNIHQDLEEFLKLLNHEKVKYLIVGGYAVAFHGYVRNTQDIDIFFQKSQDNIQKLRAALDSFGMPTTGEQAGEFSEFGSRIRLGVPPVQIELINTISGVYFSQAWKSKIKGHYGEIEVYYLSFKDLIKNKKTSGRPKDLADLDELGEGRSRL